MNADVNFTTGLFRTGALVLTFALASPQMAPAQGFAGLGAEADGFALPDPARALDFPADHGAHPDYRIEWWYLTAVLTGEDGQDYGAQWTLFRLALSLPGTVAAGDWTSPQVWMGHAAVTSATTHHFAEKLGRGGIGQAGVTAVPFAAWIDDWQMAATGTGTGPSGADAISALRVQAGAEAFSYDLALQATGPVVPQGANGYSVKSAAGQASYYYSQPFYRVEGRLQIDGAEVAVTGDAWFDHEWSSQPLAPDQTGWDWFSLMLDDGARLMGFRLRDAGGGFTSATWIAPDGTPSPLPPGALIATPLNEAVAAGRRLPVSWRLQLAARGLDVTLAPLNAQAWNPSVVPYWEGPVRITGSHKGRGYLEMTGYALDAPDKP